MQQEKAEAIARAVFEKLDRPVRRSEEAPKTALLEFLGVPKAGKTALITEVERFFRREKYKVFCAHESAEIDPVRRLSRADIFTFQTRHLIYDLSNIIDYTHDKDFHLVTIDRGVLDILVWLEHGRRKGDFSEETYQKMSDFILAGPWMEAIDAYIYVTCAPEVALRREYEHAVTQKRGSNMNEENLLQFVRVYEDVVENIQQTFPHLPLFRLDTSDKESEESAAEILDFLLPQLQKRFAVEDAQVIGRSFALLREYAATNAFLQDQMKLQGWPDPQRLAAAGWRLNAVTEQEDWYLVPQEQSGVEETEFLHLRREGERGYSFTYRRTQRDNPTQRAKTVLPIAAEDVPNLLSAYEPINSSEVVKKIRRVYHHNGRNDVLLVCDDVEGLGRFTEIHASPSENMPPLLSFAQELGFTEKDVVRGSYRFLRKTQIDTN